MHILYIHQYFHTPKQPGGTRSYWIARELIKQGHSVTMLSTDTALEKNKDEKIVDGIKLISFKVSYDQKMNILERLRSFTNFMFKSTLQGLKEKNVDLVIATSTPLTVGFPALVLKWFKGKPFLFEVRDLWPEVPIQMGGLNNSILKKLAIWFEKTIYRNSSHIIALSPGMADGVKKYVSENKVSMIPNMSKIDEFWPRNKDYHLAEKLGLKRDSFKIIHCGALGNANGAMSIIESAKLVKDDDSIEFVFIGGGATEENLISECRKHEMSNVHFLGRFPMKETSEIMNLCDVSIVSFMDLPILYTNSPNKLFDSLSAGKPIIVNSAGWTKELVDKNKCGYYVNPNNPKDLVDKITYLNKDSSIVKEMGENSRKLAEDVYDKSILCNQFVKIVEEILM